MKCIVPFVNELVSNQPRSQTRKDKRDDRRSRERNVLEEREILGKEH